MVGSPGRLDDAGDPVRVLGGIHAGLLRLSGPTASAHQGPEGPHRGHARAREQPLPLRRPPSPRTWGSRPADGHPVRDAAGGRRRGDAGRRAGSMPFIGFRPCRRSSRKQGRSRRRRQPGGSAVGAVFCCMLVGESRVRAQASGGHEARHARDPEGQRLCANEPERVAQRLVDWGYAPRSTTRCRRSELPYAKWRSYDAEDTNRFYALRLHEARLIKSTPQRIISQGTTGASCRSSSGS